MGPPFDVCNLARPNAPVRSIDPPTHASVSRQLVWSKNLSSLVGSQISTVLQSFPRTIDSPFVHQSPPQCLSSLTLRGTQPCHSYKCGKENATRNSVFDYLFLEKLVGIARARFCHYFTLPIRIPLIPEEGKFPNKIRSFLKIPA
jgi:hypothetical protein